MMLYLPGILKHLYFPVQNLKISSILNDIHFSGYYQLTIILKNKCPKLNFIEFDN